MAPRSIAPLALAATLALVPLQTVWAQTPPASPDGGTGSSATPRTAAAAAARTSAQRPYTLQSGDVLEVSVAGLPDLRQRSVVDLNGSVAIPMAPVLTVAGLTLPEVQVLVKRELSQKLFQRPTSDGRESVAAISPEAVSVVIAEYRPVYLTGDVTKPGAQPFRPGMTVRQAVALAGGYEIMRFRMNDPFLESADLRNDYQALWTQFAREQARIWRLRAELEPTQAKALDEQTQAPLPLTELNRIRDTARQELQVRQAQSAAEETHLRKAVQLANDQITLLKARQLKDNENVQVDASDYDKLKDFSAKGNLSMTRLSEARRLYLFSATQSLQTEVQLTNTLRERGEAERRIARVGEERRKEILAKLQTAQVTAVTLRARLQAVSEKVAYTGMIRSQLSRGGGASPEITVHHAAADGGGSTKVSEDAEVLPGDTVEVALHTELPVPAPQ